jgi:hypothetical protein
MPVGCRLRFRYDEKIVPAELRESFRENRCDTQDVLIAYLARYDKTVAPTAVPLRAAKLLGSKVIGRIVVLDFELREFKIADDLRAFNQALISEANTPKWEGGQLVGMFCNSINKALSYVKQKVEITDWQDLVSELHKFDDFKSISFFYFVEGIFQVGTNNLINASKGTWPLRANSTYEIRIVHYSPDSKDEGSIRLKDVDFLLADSEDEHIAFVSTTRLAVDSPYDEKILRFRTKSCTSHVDSLITFFRLPLDASFQREAEETKPVTGGKNLSDRGASFSDSVFEFDMSLRISPRVWTLTWQGLLVGAFLGFQGLVPILWNPQITDKPIRSFAAIGLGLVAGVIASFGLRRP